MEAESWLLFNMTFSLTTVLTSKDVKSNQQLLSGLGIAESSYTLPVLLPRSWPWWPESGEPLSSKESRIGPHCLSCRFHFSIIKWSLYKSTSTTLGWTVKEVNFLRPYGGCWTFSIGLSKDQRILPKTNLIAVSLYEKMVNVCVCIPISTPTLSGHCFFFPPSKSPHRRCP